MKTTQPGDTKPVPPLSRRKFLEQGAGAALAVCDPNKASADYPQWDTHEFSKSVRALLGVDSGWDWLSPDQPIQLTHALKVTSGVSGREPCQQIVNAYYATRQPSGKYNGCAAYGDYRELLEKQKDVDAVVVCTTDNLHAAVSAAAMKRRKHVFCQKPLTRTIYEARRLAEIARETGVATQSPWATRLRKPPACSASGSGMAPSDPCAKCKTGRRVPSGRRASSARTNRNRCPKVWIGTHGSGLPPTGHLATPICPLCGGVGPTSAAARWETWVLTASIPSFAC